MTLNVFCRLVAFLPKKMTVNRDSNRVTYIAANNDSKIYMNDRNGYKNNHNTHHKVSRRAFSRSLQSDFLTQCNPLSVVSLGLGCTLCLVSPADVVVQNVACTTPSHIVVLCPCPPPLSHAHSLCTTPTLSPNHSLLPRRVVQLYSFALLNVCS